MNTRSLLAVLTGLLMIGWLGGAGPSCQEAGEPVEPAQPAEELFNETLVSQADASLRSGVRRVMMKGIAGKYERDPGNTVVYSLTDRYNDVILVRGSRPLDLGTAYVVFGTLVRDSDTDRIELIEDTRRKPVTPHGQVEPPAPWRDGGVTPPPPPPEEPEGGIPDWALYGIGAFFIVLAIILGVYIAVRQKRIQREQWRQAEEERLAAERARLAREAQGMSGTTGGPGGTVLMDGSQPPGSRPPADTIQAWGRLEIIEGTNTGTHFPLAGREIIIGRDQGDVRLGADPAVSGRHGSILQTNDGRILYTDESSNGSVVDGKPVHRAQAELRSGSELQLGVSKLRLTIVAPAMAAPAGVAAGSEGRATVLVGIGDRPTQAFTGHELRVASGQSAGTSVPLPATEASIGRADGSDLQLLDATVSRMHATVRMEEGAHVLENHSQAGTLVNGKAITGVHRLRNGDAIQLGEVKLTYVELE